MQASNIFFSQAPVPKLKSNGLSTNQKQATSKTNFFNTLQEASSSIKQEDNAEQPKGTSKDSNKVNQQDGKGGQQSKKDSGAKRNVVSFNVEETLPEDPANPQDTLELTQLVNSSLPVALLCNLPEVQEVDAKVEVQEVDAKVEVQEVDAKVEVQEVDAKVIVQETMGFSKILTSTEENLLNPPTEEQFNIRSNQVIQPVQNNLVPVIEPVINTIADQLTEKESLIDTNQMGTSISQKTYAITEQTTKNLLQQDNQVVESLDTNMVPVKTTNSFSQANSVVTRQVGEEIESGKIAIEDNSQGKQDSLKEFWQNLKGKIEINQTKVNMVELAGQQLQQQNKNAGEENNLSQGISLMDHSIKATAEKVAFNDFYHTMKNLDENELIQQVIQKVRVNLQPGLTEMRMDLKPEHLGQLQMKLVMEDGKVTAQFLTNNQSTKETIENNLSQLRQSLQDQGIRVEKLSVLIGGGNLHFNQGRKEESFTGNQRQGKSWRKISSDSYDEKIIEGIPSIHKQTVSDSGVDYMA